MNITPRSLSAPRTEPTVPKRVSETVSQNETARKKDSVSFSTDSIRSLSRLDSSVDKGTASETTVFLDRSSFDALMQETTFGETKWEEMGGDDTKMWVVVNGQRFEYQRSAEEIAERKKLQGMANKTLIDYLEEAQKEHEAQKKDGRELKTPMVKDGKLSFDSQDLAEDPKLQNLVQNKPVMDVLNRLAERGVLFQMHT